MKKPGTDVIKVLAVIAVVLIHVFAAVYFSVLKQNQNARIYFVVADQLWRFSVPVFVAISGFGLMTGYSTKTFNFFRYLSRRLWRLVPWYLVAATLTILLVTFVWHEDQALYHGAKLWRLYFLGQADYHLYFVPMIIQLYLLFPIFLFLFRRMPPIFLVVLAFAWQVVWYWFISQKTEFLGNNNGFWPDQEQYRNFASWIFYFVLGMYFAGKGKVNLLLGLGLTSVGLAWAITNSIGSLAQGLDIFVATRFTRLPVLVYATGAIVLGKYLIDNLSMSQVKEKLWHRLGDYSYLIYLFHPLAIRVVLHTLGVY